MQFLMEKLAGPGPLFTDMGASSSHHPFRLLSESASGCRSMLELCAVSPQADTLRKSILAHRPLYKVELDTLMHHWGHELEASRRQEKEALCKQVHDVAT